MYICVYVCGLGIHMWCACSMSCVCSMYVYIVCIMYVFMRPVFMCVVYVCLSVRVYGPCRCDMYECVSTRTVCGV